MITVIQREPVKPVLPPPVARAGATNVECPGWPFDAKEAQRRQRAGGGEISQTIDLGAGVALDLVRIPAGEFVMGDATGYADERPRRERIAQSFWIGKLEVTNAQFARFDAEHDSRYIRTHGISSTRGYAVNRPQQPVVRVSWEQAMAYCDWLSEKTDRRFTLPDEVQWEYACRAGTATPLAYGDLDTDFSQAANLGGVQLEHLRDYSHNSKLAWMPRDVRFDDQSMVSAQAGRYAANAWGLYDMHGNAAEWTTSEYEAGGGKKVVRGGSWRDRPLRARSAFRLGYPAWQKVYNVGFRVVCLDGGN